MQQEERCGPVGVDTDTAQRFRKVQMKVSTTKHDAVMDIIKTLHLQKDWIEQKPRYWKSALARVIIENLIRNKIIEE